jgi:AcrR family transcriptional regulator
LIEDGFDATTIPAVAKRAGVGAPTIRRRWPTQIELIEAIFDDILQGELADFEGAGFEKMIEVVAEGAFQFFGHPAARRALPGLLVAYNGDRARYEALTARIEVPSRAALRKAHKEAVAQGIAARKPDSDTLFSAVVASAWYYAAVRGETSPRVVRAVVDLALRSVRP